MQKSGITKIASRLIITCYIVDRNGVQAVNNPLLQSAKVFQSNLD